MATAKLEVLLNGLTPMEEAFAIAIITHPHWRHVDCYLSVYAQEDQTIREARGGMKRTTAHVESGQLYRKPRVRARIEELRLAIAKEAIVTEGRALAEVLRIALADPIDLFDDDGSYKPICEMDPDIRCAISSIEYDTVKVKDDGENDGASVVAVTMRPKKVTMWDKNVALEKVLKVLGMYEKDNRQRAGIFDNLPAAMVSRIRERVLELEQRRSGVAGDGTAGSPDRTTH